MIASKKKRQKCFDCKNCDGFACLRFDLWLDGKVKVSSREGKGKSNYIPVEDYGKKYCRMFKRRTAELTATVKDFPYSIDTSGGKIKTSHYPIASRKGF